MNVIPNLPKEINNMNDEFLLDLHKIKDKNHPLFGSNDIFAGSIKAFPNNDNAPGRGIVYAIPKYEKLFCLAVNTSSKVDQFTYMIFIADPSVPINTVAPSIHNDGVVIINIFTAKMLNVLSIMMLYLFPKQPELWGLT